MMAFYTAQLISIILFCTILYIIFVYNNDYHHSTTPYSTLPINVLTQFVNPSTTKLRQIFIEEGRHSIGETQRAVFTTIDKHAYIHGQWHDTKPSSGLLVFGDSHAGIFLPVIER
jgi:hypothetical protein